MGECNEELLIERRRKLNKDFRWTEENKKRFLEISDTLTNVFEKAYAEALSIAKVLETRIANKDSFLKDYEIEIRVIPYVKYDENDEAAEDISGYLAEPPGYNPISHHISHCHYEREANGEELPLYLDKSTNWDDTGLMKQHFGGCNMSYAMHDLIYHTGIWSFSDILNIGKIWADVKVTHQYFEEMQTSEEVK